VFSCLRATVMAASFDRLIVCRTDCDLMSMCVVMCGRGFTTPAPSVLLPLTCDPSVYTKSLEFYFLLWVLVYIILVGWRDWIGVGMSLYAVLLFTLSASGVVVSRSVVFIV
jgi:hypothetical protein